MADTGATLPGLGSTEDRDGKLEWSNPQNIQAEADFTFIIFPEATYGDWLRASQFGFAIPSTANILGVKVEINRRGGVADYLYDSSLRLVDASGTNIGDDKASGSAWPTDPTTATYGSSTDLWGVTLTPAIVNDSDFGIRLSARNSDSGIRLVVVYWVKITVYYKSPTAITQPADPIHAPSATLQGKITEDADVDCEARFRHLTEIDSVNTGAKLPLTGATEDRDGNEAWISPQYIQTEENGSYCSVGLNDYSDWLRASNFNFSIPDTARILGIKVEINRDSDSAVIKDSSLRLVNNNGTNIGDDKSSASIWPISSETAIYGGTTDLWNATLTPAIVNSSNFGVRLSAFNTFLSGSVDAYVYWIKVTIYYVEWTLTDWQAFLRINDTFSEALTGLTPETEYEFQTQARYHLIGDDFEWGNDGDDITDSGGDITWSKTEAGTAKISTEQAYSGTRSAKLTYLILAYFTWAADTGYAIHCRIRKSGSVGIVLTHGNGSKRILVGYDVDEKLYYWDDEGQFDTGASIVVDTQTLLEIRNIDWTAGTYDIYQDNVLVKSSATMYTDAGYTNQIGFDASIGSGSVYIDDVVIANETESDWSDSEYFTTLAYTTWKTSFFKML